MYRVNLCSLACVSTVRISIETTGQNQIFPHTRSSIKKINQKKKKNTNTNNKTCIYVHTKTDCGEKGDCHPKCQWKCDSPVCNQVCEPICEQPRCSTRCQELGCSKCAIKCDKPQCEVRCPVKHCEKGACPKCDTVCKEPQCHTECTNPTPKCESVCEEPLCICVNVFIFGCNCPYYLCMDVEDNRYI